MCIAGEAVLTPSKFLMKTQRWEIVCIQILSLMIFHSLMPVMKSLI